MAGHNGLGQRGEELAAAHLTRLGYAVLHRNWRYGRSEVDLIALREGRLHFIEVKLRRSHRYGRPEQAVDDRKLAFLLRAAAGFLAQHPHYTDFRIDVVAITLHNGSADILFIKDIYK